ncbi:MAG: VWA domain-containing protein [Thermoanaerobaculia bacterium]|nr:VWA domain-containing protein [Thermoanaerobaculia bacterium]
MKLLVRKFAGLTLAATLALTPAYAQQPPAGDLPKLVENIDVRVINIDVVVTDRKGNPVTGLKRTDFEVFENKVPKPISNFFAVEGGKPIATEDDPVPAPSSAATPAPRVNRREEVPEQMKRRIIFYIDNLSLAPFNRNRVFQTMKGFVRTTMRPGDEAMIVTFNRSMKIRVPFTKDVTQINQTFDGIAGESALGGSNRSERKQVEDRIRDARSYDEAVGTARTYASSVEHDLRQSATSINGLMSTLAGVPGKKILVLTTEGFPMQPGREVFQYIEEIGREKQWNATGTLLEGMAYNSTNVIQSIARAANANGITLYPIHAAGLTGGAEFSAEYSAPTAASVSMAATTNTTESVQLMADMTGGLASTQTNNFADAFKRIQRDLDSYYSLGYRASTERVDRQRYVSVRLKNNKNGYVVRNRQTFVEKSTFAEMNDRVIANLFYRTKANDLNIIVRTGAPHAVEDGLYQVPVEIQIPMDNLTLLPQGETEHVGGFEVYVAVADKNGDMSDVSRRSHTLRVAKEDAARAKGKFYTYSLDLLMEKGLNKISVGVVDSISNTNGFAREQVIAQDLR